MKVCAPKQFLAFITSLENIAKEAVFRVDGQGISCLTMGTSNANAIIASFAISDWDNKPRTFGVDTSLFLKCIKSMKGEYDLLFPTQHSLTVSGGQKKHVFTMLEHADIREAKRDFVPGTSKVTLKSARFKEMVDDALTFGDAIILQAKETQLVVEGSNDSNTCSTVATEEITATVASLSKYSGPMLLEIAPLLKEYAKVELSWAASYPIHVNFEDDFSKVQYILANRSDV